MCRGGRRESSQWLFEQHLNSLRTRAASAGHFRDKSSRQSPQLLFEQHLTILILRWAIARAAQTGWRSPPSNSDPMSGSPLRRAGAVRRRPWGAKGCSDGLAWRGERVAGLSRGPALRTFLNLVTYEKAGRPNGEGTGGWRTRGSRGGGGT